MYLKFRLGMVVFLTLLFFTTACGTDDADNSDVVLPVLLMPESGAPPAVSDLCNNALYPSSQGATWIYTSTGGPDGSFNYTNTITESRVDGFTLTTQFVDITRTQEWSCQPDGLQALQLGGGSAVGISVQGMTTNLTALEITGINLPKNIVPGAQWQYSLSLEGTVVMPDNPQAPAKGVYSVATQEMGRETITVPAGTFDAVKLQSNSTVDIVSVFAGADAPINFHGTTITWYAPGVGYVKSVENGGFGGETFSTTTELQSYNVP